MKNKTIAILGIGSCILSVITSATDLEGNFRFPIALIAISGILSIIFTVAATVRLWKGARYVSIILASSIIILFVLGVVQGIASPAYGSPIIILSNITIVIHFVAFIWAIIKLWVTDKGDVKGKSLDNDKSVAQKVQLSNTETTKLHSRNITFPTYYLIGFLNSMGWPKKTGLFIKKEVVNEVILSIAVQGSVVSAIALGVAKPMIAVCLLADIFRKRNLLQEPVKELWSKLDPYEEIKKYTNKAPEKIIAPLTVSMNEMESLVDWKCVFGEDFQSYLHWRFCQGLVWGLNHPKEAIRCHENQQQESLKYIPVMLKSGVDVHPIEPLGIFAEQMETVVNSYQNDICTLGAVQKELLNLPEVIARINQSDLAAAHYNLGITCCELGHYQDAIESCKEAIKIKPDFARAHCSLGFAYGELGRHQEEIEAYKQAIIIEKDLAMAHYSLGNTYGKLGRYQDAIEAYKQAIKIKPDYADAQHNLRVAYGKLGHH
jgi:hypothetical protein